MPDVSLVRGYAVGAPMIRMYRDADGVVHLADNNSMFCTIWATSKMQWLDKGYGALFATCLFCASFRGQR
jgi:hypothetical protein